MSKKIWGDGEHSFLLSIGQYRELQEKVNRWRVAIGGNPIGPLEFARSLKSGNAWPDEVSEVLRLGLIGGGMKPLDAAVLIRRYGPDVRPLLESSLTAFEVFTEGIAGVPDDPVGKKPEPRKRNRTNRSNSAKSTEPVQPSASALDKSTNSPSGNLPPASTDTTEPKAARNSPSP